jgi:hypothetical protein
VSGAGPTSAGTTSLFGDRPSFLATLGASVTDDYSAAGYQSGDVSNGTSVDIFTNAGMSAVLGETDYASTYFANDNYVQTVPSIAPGPFYCAGCDGSFRLGFTSTSVGTGLGVYGVGLDLVLSGGTTAFVTFGDGSSIDYGLPTGGFWGLTDDRRISSIHFGLPGGGAVLDPATAIAIDNLTIGASIAPVPVPPALPLIAAALAGLVALRARRLRA